MPSDVGWGHITERKRLSRFPFEDEQCYQNNLNCVCWQVDYLRIWSVWIRRQNIPLSPHATFCPSDKMSHCIPGDKMFHFLPEDKMSQLMHREVVRTFCRKWKRQALPKVWRFKLKKWDKMSQQLPCRRGESGTFCRLGQFFARKMPVGEYGYAWDMAKICPIYVQDVPEICTSFAQGMGIQIDKVGQNIAREGALVGTLCRRGGARCGGTFCLLTWLIPQQMTKSFTKVCNIIKIPKLLLPKDTKSMVGSFLKSIGPQQRIKIIFGEIIL